MEHNLKSFIHLVANEDLAKAQDVIKQRLNEKLNSIMGDKFEDYAPSIFEAAKPDFLDLDGDGDKEESMKKAAEEAEEGEEDVEEDEEQSEEEEEGETEDEEDEETEEDSEETEEEQD